MPEGSFRPVHTIARAGIMLIGFSLLASCGAKDDPKYADISSYCKGRAEAECSKEVLQACAIAEQSRCVTKRQAACVAAAPAGATYNPSGAEACVNAVSTAFADARLSSQENRTVIETCAALYDGPGSANAPCQKDIDCKVSANLRCVLRGGATTGTCQVPQRVTGGGVCSSPAQSCVPDYHCGATDHCDVNSKVGEVCSDVLPCVEAARCSAGKCEKKFDDGTACVSDQECANALCARGSGAAQGVCVSQMSLAPNEPFCVDAR
jgi:hypothetical protein